MEDLSAKVAELQRKLEVEAALDRIRARAMAMQSSDELSETSLLLTREVKALGISVWGCAFHIYNEEQGNSTEWFSTTEVSSIYKTPREGIFLDYYNKGKEGVPLHVQSYSEEQSKAHYDYLKTLPGHKSVLQWYQEQGEQVPAAQLDYAAYFKYGYLLFVTYEAVPEAEEVFVRFAKTFEQVYARFLDLRKAEAQAREAQIEFALERVRSQTMAMRHSDDIYLVSTVLFQEIGDLGIYNLRCGVLNIFDDPARCEVWPSMLEENTDILHLIGKLQMDIHPLLEGIFAAWKSQEEIFQYELFGEDSRNFYQTIANAPDYHLPFDATPDRQVCNAFIFSEGALFSFTPDYMDEEAFQIWERFRGAFSFAHSRFLDLKKAEAQAREAHIEAALERVRSRTMAMHDSIELEKVAALMYREFIELGFDQVRQCGYSVIDTENNLQKMWLTQFDGNPMAHFTLPLKGDKLVSERFEEWSSGARFQYQVTPMSEFTKHLKRVQASLNEQQFEMALKKMPDPIHFYQAFFNQGYLHIVADEVLSEAQESTMERFSTVFEQTYTRFLDLQQAEAQAREAQMEAALERVRSRSLAMQKSEELVDVIEITFGQLRNLNLVMDGCGIDVFEDDSGDFRIWSATPEHTYPLELYIPYIDHPVMNRVKTARESNEQLFTDSLSKEVIRTYYQHTLENTVMKDVISGDRQKRILQADGFNRVMSVLKNTGFFIFNFREYIYSEEDQMLIARFGKVFEQTYTRFLDLQKAEEQAYEARIQTALERIRSAAMAMHSSDGLSRVAEVLREQMALLGQKELESCIVQLYEKGSDTYVAYYSFKMPNATNKKLVHDVAIVPWKETAWSRKVISQYEAGIDTFGIHAEKAMLEEWYAMLAKVSPRTVEYDRVDTLQVPDELYYYFACFSGGFLSVISYDPPTHEAKQLLIRAANTFDIAYRRFQDLQKAETQAREAEIELALERVRAKSMAMHETSGLNDVILVVFQQFQELNIRLDSCFINVFNEGKDLNLWISTGEGLTYPYSTFPYIDNPLFNRQEEARQRGESFFTLEMTRKEKDSFFDHFFKHLSGVTVDKKRKDYIYNSKGVAISFALFEHAVVGMANYQGEPYSDEENAILRRISKVFEQTYTRFLDLQKAEAQAREAQIEAALERVRARSMAMHKSEELQDVIVLVYEQMSQLGISTDSVQVEIFKEDSDHIHCWVANEYAPYGSEVVIEDLGFGFVKDLVEARKAGEEEFFFSVDKEIKDKYYDLAFRETDLQMLPEGKKKRIAEGRFLTVYEVFKKKTGLQLGAFDVDEFPEEDKRILRRFAEVFDQFYIRFLDLRRAEEQAREAQIEASLERVRSRTMGMHHSNELAEVAGVCYGELRALGIVKESDGFHFTIYDEENETADLWVTEPGGTPITQSLELSLSAFPPAKATFDKWRAKPPQSRSEQLSAVELSPQDIADTIALLSAHPVFREMILTQRLTSNPPKSWWVYDAWFSQGTLVIDCLSDSIPEESLGTLSRFAKVFEQTYTRFLDLQKAEAQAREAQIEAALERVRARAMALHHSEELKEVIAIIYQQLTGLGLKIIDTNIGIEDEETRDITFWGSGLSGIEMPPKFTVPYLDQKIVQRLHYWDRSNQFHYYHLKGREFQSYWKILLRESEYKDAPKEYMDVAIGMKQVHLSHVSIKHGMLEVASDRKFSDDQIEILKQFGSVVDLTYTRFVDLQKAEAQAREAQIEAALERVRSRSMGMQSSDELVDILQITFDELTKMGMDLARVIIWIFNEKDRSVDWWITNPESNNTATCFHMPEQDHELYRKYWEAYDQQLCPWLYTLEGEEKRTWHRQIFSQTRLSGLPEAVKTAMQSPGKVFLTNCFNKYSVFLSGSHDPLPEEHTNIMLRFGQVFEQSYTRFRDIEQAEAQARDAQIEAALERVRARSMAMHDSSELIEVATLMFREFEKLDLEAFLTCGYLIPDEAAEVTRCWFAQTQRDFLVQFDALLTGDPVLDDRYKAWKEQVPIFKYEVGGAQLAHHLQIVFPLDQRNEEEDLAVVAMPDPTIFYTANFSHGYILVIADHEMDRDQERILLRFRSTFEQAYIRFLDLQKAEEQAKLAIRQSVTDRIRAEITSMRTPKDLERITPLMWKELINLGVPFFRCGIFIMDEVHRIAHTYLTTPQGESLAAIDVTFDANPLAQASVENWRRQEVYVTEWDQKQFIANMTALLDDKLLEDPDRYQHGEPAPERLVLHLVPFKQGMLYVGNTDHLDPDQIELVKLLAQTFSVAYARYEDFTQLEEAKLRVESALNDLQSTQSQLVHAEKMASLGELTAGIAHEIQNPLNFVNNFSDLNKELIDDLREELKEGNIEEVEAILQDVFGNEEKILFHGKRAEEIVKSMLQHSRAGDGEKRPADINAIADEYLRLSYHGLRAKDKSFNAEFKAHLAEDLPEIQVVPQDIGRVLLNLINNAFSAVSERREADGNGYVPTVEVFTSKVRSGIEIRVKDNGPGVPDDIREKIFQPFFTTKPTGSGTGLGLSLSYDIVTKGHGGTLEMETSVGDGTEFRIQLPIV